MDKNLKRIEFDKILDILSEEAYSYDAKNKIQNIKPFSDIKKVKEVLKQTFDAYSLSIRFSAPEFSGLISVKKIISRVCSGAFLHNSEFLSLLSTLKTTRRIKAWWQTCIDTKTSLDDKFEKIYVNNYLEKKIESIVLSESEISDNASQELFNIRGKIRMLNKRIRDSLEKMVNSPLYKKYLTDSIITNRSGRFVVQVKSEYRNEVKGLVQDVSSSGATFFIEPIGVVEENNKINELKIKEKSEIDKILFSLSREVEKFAENILNSYDYVVELDEIFAKASLAIRMNASLPEVNEKGEISLKKARHPLIPKEKVQPIDINLGKDFDALIITGPNTGGKTVAIKTIGLMCAMAMSGLMIPAADGSEISVFNEILTDIGDEQSIEQSVSTFSSHMCNIVGILEKASCKTLVLLDEIGAGTDPEEGAALSIAIIENLRKKNSKLVVTTHYKELKEYAVTSKRVECASCEFDLENLKPTYKILIGSIGNSNAFLISEKLGLDKKIIENAKNILGEEKIKLNEILAKAEQARREFEKKNETIEKLYLEINKNKEDIKIEKEKIEKEKWKIIEEARFKAKNILNRVRAESENLIKNLNNIKDLSAENRRDIKSKIKEMENLVDPIEENAPINTSSNSFKEGDSVFIQGVEKEGVICSQEDDKGNFLVAVGKIKTKISKSRLRYAPKRKEKTKNYNLSVFKKNTAKEVKMDIDLRGKTVLEAYQELGLFLDSSFISGIKQITIIHGKGSGSLRKGVHDILKKNKHVKSFRLGGFSEGGDGATIVSLI